MIGDCRYHLKYVSRVSNNYIQLSSLTAHDSYLVLENNKEFSLLYTEAL